MPEQPDYIIYGVTAVAFVVGYLVVGFVIKHLKALKARPPLNEELWREQENAKAMRQPGSPGNDSLPPEAMPADNNDPPAKK